MISFECPSCHKKLSVKEELAGKKGKCPQCRNTIRVPGAAAPVSVRHAGGGGARVGESAAAPVSSGPAYEQTLNVQPDETSRDGRSIPPAAPVPARAPEPAATITNDLGQLGVYKLLKV